MIDVSGRDNIAGAGINIAQRVMDCGDAGHILLSKHVADNWNTIRAGSHLHSLGECEVKHGVRLGVVNLYNHEVGNPQLPSEFGLSAQRRSRARSECDRNHIVVALRNDCGLDRHCRESRQRRLRRLPARVSRSCLSST